MATKRTRASVKQEAQAKKEVVGRVVKEKYVSQVEDKLNNFQPSESQKHAIKQARDNTLCFIQGPAGTGKTSAILWDYCREYLRDNTKRIVIVRSAFEAGQLDKIGFLPNELEDKIAPHFESSRKILNDFLGKNKVDCDIGSGRISFQIPNYMLGKTIDNALVLLDEGQVLQPMIMKLILERIGLNSRVVVAGDTSQLYAGTQEAHLRNGLSDALYRFIKENGEPRYKDIGYYKFEVEDIQRSEIVKTVVRAYSN